MHIYSDDEFALLNLSFWLDEDPSKVKKHISKNELSELGRTMKICKKPCVAIFSRKVLSGIHSLLPSRQRFLLNNLLKKSKAFLHVGSKSIKLMRVDQLLFHSTISKLRNEFGSPGLALDGRRTIVCISHDVDYLECYDYVKELTALEKRHGLKSTFNFLTNWDYSLEPGLLSFLKKNNFGVGLHGYTHDIAFGYRSKRKMGGCLGRALRFFPFRIKGYRAPAFSISESLLAELKRNRIAYDSSLQVFNPMYHSVQTCFPYVYFGANIWELPLTLQDDTFFRDFNVSDENAFEITKSILHEVEQLGGIFILNAHPSVIKKHSRYYAKFLKHLVHNKNIRVLLTDELYELLEQRFRHYKKKFNLMI